MVFVPCCNIIKMAENMSRAKQAALEAAEESFRKLDVNGDGKISKAELEQMASQTELVDIAGDRATREAKIAEFFETFDTDGDGKVSLEEWMTFFGRLYDTICF